MARLASQRRLRYELTITQSMIARLSLLFLILSGAAASSAAPAGEDRRAYPALFERAARESGVPADVLKAVAFAETRWAHLTWPAGERVSPCNGMPRPFGIMSLWDNDHFGHSLRDAAALIGQPVEVLQADVFQNMRGAAALLKKLHDEQPLPEGTRRRDFESWRNAIAAYCGIPEPELAQQHALDVFASTHRGYHQHGIEWPGRRVDLEPIRAAVRKTKERAAHRRAVKQPAEAEAEGGVVFTPAAQPDYPGAIWRPAYAGHWSTSGSGRYFVVIHDMEGYYLSTISYFQQSGTQASAHFCVNGLKDSANDAPAGEITQMVEERYWAWHARCWNGYMLGIEHEGFVSDPAWYTEAQYQASANLTRYLCDKYAIPKDRNHIIAHGQKLVPGWTAWMAANWPQIDAICNDHTDPGANWDWTHYMALIIGDVNNAAVTSLSAPDTVAPGASFSATITLQNTGTKAWASDATPHRLGSQNPQDATRWGLTRVNLPSSPVNPGASAAFTFTCTAPTAAGSYAFDWRMVEENTEWFGATAAKTILVAVLPPVIIAQPTNVVRNPGELTVLGVVATGLAPMTYSWRKDGVRLTNGGKFSGTGLPTLAINNAQLAEAGFYSVVVSNAGGATISQAAQLLLTAPPFAVGSGAGLRALVFDNADFTSIKRARIDATVDADWTTNSPSSTTDADTFSIRWLGQVQPRYSQTYTFHTTTDDGVRLWVNGAPLIDQWQDQGATEWTGSIALTAGEKYDLRLDYYENSGAASAQLAWSSASQVKEVVPSTQLYRPPPVIQPITNRVVAPGGNVSLTAGVTNWDAWLSAQPIAAFNDFVEGQDDVMFRYPIYSGSTDQFVDASETNYTAVITAVPAGNPSAACLKTRWAFTNGVANPWLRLTTANMANVPNPAIDFAQSVWFDINPDRPVRAALGVRETGTTTALGGDGGQSGTIEFVGVTAVTNGQPFPPRLVAANTWTTLAFDLSREPARGFTGNGVLSSTNGRGALEHLAIVPADGSGIYRVHLDNFLSVVNNRLSFALEPSAPAGAMINSTNGLFSWPVPGGQAPGAYPVGVRVTDSGSPSLSATQTFLVIVETTPRLSIVRLTNGFSRLSWNSAPGRSYRVQVKPAFGAAWQDIATVPAGPSASTSHDDGPPLAQRFYRVMTQ